jgi:hypothetical protein
MNFITVSESDLGAGIDQQSAESRIQPGFSEDLVNVDPQAEGYLAKRPGYQGVAGYMPVRVSSIQYSGTSLCFTLDASVDLTGVTSSPIVVYGRTSGSSVPNLPFQPYSSAVPNKGEYFPSFEVDDKKVLLAANTSLVIPATEHGQSGLFLVKLFTPTGSGNESVGISSYQIDTGTNALTLNYGVAVDTDIYISYRSLASVPGSVYVHPVVTATTVTIPAATHGLSNYNIITDFYEVTGAVYESIEPDSLTVSTSGQVVATFSTSVNVVVVLRSVPFSQQEIITIPAIGPGTATINNIAGHYLDSQVYVRTAANPGVLEQVLLDSIIVNTSNNTAVLSWTNYVPFTEAVVYYEPISILSNKLCVNISTLTKVFTASGSTVSTVDNRITIASHGFTNGQLVTFSGSNLPAPLNTTTTYNIQVFDVNEFYVYNGATLVDLTTTGSGQVSIILQGEDLSPQLTIWGLKHSEIYGDNPTEDRVGWTTHIDSYRAAGNNRVVAGLGGNLYGEYNILELSVDYKLPTLYTNLRARALNTTRLAPAFFGLSTLTPGDYRTDGWYRFTGGEQGLATATSAEWISGTQVKYTLSTPALQSSAISIVTDQQLTITQSANPKNSGVFNILSITTSSNAIEIVVNNPLRTSTDDDEVGSGMQAGIFTDTIPLIADSPFLPGDRIQADSFGDEELLTVTSSTASRVVISGLASSLYLQGGQRIIGQRTSRILPLRDALEAPTVENLVRGDMLSVSGIDRKLRVEYINTLSDNVVSITDDTITSVSSTSGYVVGQLIELVRAGNWSGTWAISEIVDTNSLKIDCDIIGSTSGTILGKTVQVDEEFQFSDTVNSIVAVQVSSRWVPLEAPDDEFSLTPTTHENYFPANTPGSQPILKSAMVSDNMYFSNGDDSVMKWDGAALVRAGLPRFQPQLFTSVDSQATGKIVLNLVTITAADIDERIGSVIKLAEYSSSPLSVGDTIEITGTIDTIKAVITKMWQNTTTNHDYVQISYNGDLDTDLGALNTAAASISQTATYRYYFRLNAIDNNDNLIASSVTGVDDCVVELTENSQIRLRLASFPIWDIYDYDKLQLQVYRTKKNGVAPYYLLRTIPLSFDSSRQYVDFVDANSDEVLTTLDSVSTALEGAELGTQWSSPLRSKYITSAGNRLVQGNIIADPVIDLQFLAKDLNTAITIPNFSNEIITLRRDNNNTSNISDGENVQRFHLLNAGEQSISTINFLTMTGRLRIETAATLPAVTDWVYLFRNTVADGISGLCAGWWRVVATGAGWFEVDYITDDTPLRREFLGTSVSTGADTITFATAHGLVDGDRITLEPDTGATFPVTTPALVAGIFYYVKKISATAIELHTDSGLGAGSKINITGVGAGTIYVYTVLNCNRWLKATDGRDVPVWIGTDGNINTKSGNTGVIELRVTQRLSMAINVQQRSAASPWMLAEAGNFITPAGRIIISQPKVVDTILELEVGSTLATNMQLFANGLKIPRTVAGSAVYTAGAVEYEYPSRILISYPNFPEIFSNPTAAVDSESVSVIDVNSADGQQITGIIPFFGESAFGAAQKSGVVVVFKTNSIYLIDISAKAAGVNPVQRIESQGLGCTAPHSIANTRDGIVFANESGLYRLGRNLAIEYVGQKIERVWRERVNLSQLDRVFGHHYGTGSQYKVSVPLDGNTTPGDLLVYSHVREYRGGFGAWTRYSNHPAIGWANLFSDAYFATTDGQVMSVRRTGGTSDYRDDAQPISMRALFRALDFGDSGIRKSVRFLVVKFRVVADTSSTLLFTARDLVENFEQADAFSLDDTRNNTNGLQDPNRVKIQSIRFSAREKECIYFQTLITNEELDQPVEIVEISYRVTGMTDKGMEEAAET